VQRLYTPWRRAFIERSASGESDDECFLCSGAADSDDRAHLILYRAQRVFVVLNLYPYNNGHLLIAPYAHTGEFATLDSATAADLMAETQHAVAVLEAEYRPHGFNVGLNLGRVAGAGLPGHVHVHVVPRWNGDSNFMPIVGNTKLLPETIEQTYDRLEPRFRA